MSPRLQVGKHRLAASRLRYLGASPKAIVTVASGTPLVVALRHATISFRQDSPLVVRHGNGLGMTDGFTKGGAGGLFPGL
jgi:hypothetical protein